MKRTNPTSRCCYAPARAPVTASAQRSANASSNRRTFTHFSLRNWTCPRRRGSNQADAVRLNRQGNGMGMIDHFMEKNFDDSNAVVTLRLDAISKRLPDAL